MCSFLTRRLETSSITWVTWLRLSEFNFCKESGPLASKFKLNVIKHEQIVTNSTRASLQCPCSRPGACVNLHIVTLLYRLTMANLAWQVIGRGSKCYWLFVRHVHPESPYLSFLLPSPGLSPRPAYPHLPCKRYNTRNHNMFATLFSVTLFVALAIQSVFADFQIDTPSLTQVL